MLGWFKKKLGKKSGPVDTKEPDQKESVEPTPEIEFPVEKSTDITEYPSSELPNAEIVSPPDIPVSEETEAIAQPPEEVVVHEADVVSTADQNLPETEIDIPEPEISIDPPVEPGEEESKAKETAADEVIKVIKESEEKDKNEKKKTLFSRLTERLGKTRETFTYQLDALFLGKKEIDTDLIDDLEEILITADLGVNTTQDLIAYTRRKVKRKELADPESLKQALKLQIKDLITGNEQDATLVMPEKGPFVIMVIGVNGVGKTTTIGKIAHKFQQTGSSVMLVAGDTFRAAAVSQLKIWGERNKVEVVAHKEGADPSSVVFDALGTAQDQDVDVVLVDTAGRMHTKDNLMEELKKIQRVMNKKLKGAPHEVMLVIDATTGQNGISQARLFDDAVGVTGMTLTKLDGTSKGGIVANISKELNIPIRFIGIGEQLDDLRDFDAEEFVEAMFHSGPSIH